MFVAAEKTFLIIRRKYKQHLNKVKSGMLGSNGLDMCELLNTDINSLKQKVSKLENELKN